MNGNRSGRLALIAVSTIVVNIVMFSAIQYMVGNRQIRLADTSQFDLANFIRMTEQSREVRSRRDPKAPEKPEMEAQRDVERFMEASKGSGIGGLSVSMPDINIDIDVGGSIQLARELTPLVRIPPEYPSVARMKSIEGEVILRFIVTETGAVAEPQVIRSRPEGIFERAAMRAVLRWKYQPQLANGKPISVVTYTKINFAIEKD